MNNLYHKTQYWLHANAIWLLIAAFFFLQAFRPRSYIAIILMAVFGLIYWVRHRQYLWNDGRFRFFLLLFLLVWIPMCLSLFNAVNFDRSAKTVLSFLFIPLVGAYILPKFSDKNVQTKLLYAIFAFVTIWSLDAMVQAFSGENIFGYPTRHNGRLTGMFYPEVSMGHFLALLSPLFLEVLRRQFYKRPWLTLLMIPFIATIILTGTRNAWVVLMLGFFVFMIYVIRVEKHYWRFIIVGAVLSVFAIALAWYIPSTHKINLSGRFTQTMAVFSGDAQQVNMGFSSRVTLWTTAKNMVKENFWFGIGPRGYRTVYADYAEPGDRFIERNSTQMTHPHQMLMEVFVETGFIGLLGFLVLLVLLIRFWWRSAGKLETAPWFMLALLAWFPLNMHYAFYNSTWASVCWVVLMMAIGSVKQFEKLAIPKVT